MKVENLAIKTLKVRVKDKHSKNLARQARAVNYVWNYLNEISSRSALERQRYLSAYDLQKYTSGSGVLLGLHSHTVQCVTKEYVVRRIQAKKKRLSWRKSDGSRRSLGWIPLKTGMAKWRNGQVLFNGKFYGVWDSFGLSQYEFKSASFNEDARGRWYFNVAVEVKKNKSSSVKSVGVDLGCKDAATTSEGLRLEGRWFRCAEKDLAVAHRANNRARARAINAKIANRRKDEMHKFSKKLVDENAAIFVGDISSKAATKTKLAKSALDSSWGMLKAMLAYKCDYAGVVFKEVNEAYTTQTCSSCGALPNSRPKGIAGLGIREWSCDDCGEHHDRDTNAAKNILAAGHCRLAGEIRARTGGCQH